MSSTPTRSIALTKELDAYIQAQVASGHYGSASEVVRSALRFMIEREASLTQHRPKMRQADRRQPSA